MRRLQLAPPQVARVRLQNELRAALSRYLSVTLCHEQGSRGIFALLQNPRVDKRRRVTRRQPECGVPNVHFPKAQATGAPLTSLRPGAKGSTPGVARSKATIAAWSATIAP